MAQHHRYLCTNFVGYVCPLRPFPEGKWLWCFGFEWRGKKSHRINMGVKHDLQQDRFEIVHEGDADYWLTSFSSPVRYPSFRLHSMHASRLPVAAEWRRESHLSMNSFE